MMGKKITNDIILFAAIIAVFFLTYPQALSASKKEQTDEIKEEQIDKREELRAFYTAPPVIPHEVSVRDSEECLYCHQDVTEIGNRITVKTPHSQFSNCQQCHVQGNIDKRILIPSTWEGLEEPKEGTQAHEFAPTTIPHRIFMRENCLSCHGPDNPDEKMRTSHPERSNCRQCHVTQLGVEFEIGK